MTSVFWRFNPYVGYKVWTYGNYGGPGWTGGEFTPPKQRSNFDPDGEDALDEIFKAHDQDYDIAQRTLDASGKTQADIKQGLIAIDRADVAMLASIDNLLRDAWPMGNTVLPAGQRRAAMEAQELFLNKRLYNIIRIIVNDPIFDGIPIGYPWGSGDPFTGMPWPDGDFDLWDDAQNTVSPLILDLDGDGVETRSKTAGAYFDHGADGFAENTGWVGQDDGLLVRDVDGDGTISSGRELFGNHTLLKTGEEAANGFEALKDLDANSDGFIDSQDAAFTTLKVWKDTNGNGMTDTGELLTLAQAGVKSLNVGSNNLGTYAVIDPQGNRHQQLGSFTTSTGVTQQMNDVWFGTTKWKTLDKRPMVAVSEEIETLPDFAGPGSFGSLHQAMARDSTGQLQSLVMNYLEQPDASARDVLFQEILYRWAGVQDVDQASRGSSIGDARKLVVLEMVMGERYFQYGGGDYGPTINDPGPAASAKLLVLYENVKRSFAARLDAQSWDKTLYAAINIVWQETTQTFALDVSGVVQQLRQDYNNDASVNHQMTLNHLDHFAKNLLGQGEFGYKLLAALQSAGKPEGDALEIALSNAGATQLVLVGTVGDDVLTGNEGSNYFNGHAGDDKLIGGGGADRYIFNRGDGCDVILDNGAQGRGTKLDTLQLGIGIAPSNLTLNRGIGVGQYDLVIDLGSGDQVTVQYFFYSTDYQVEAIEFADGNKWTITDIAAKLTQNGSAGDDGISGLSDYSNRMNGLEGNDNLYGGSKDDVLDGGAGNDVLNGRDGNDTLTGGVGNDTLYGSSGNDTYIFNQGDGQDMIDDYDYTGGDLNTLKLGAGLASDSMQVERSNYDLTLTWGSDSVTLQSFFYGNPYQTKVVQFADGTIWGGAELANKLVQNGSAGDDSISGLSDYSNRINGLGGNDNLYGGNKDDVLDGGAGNDVLNGGYGNDTYIFNQGDGADTINGGDSTVGNVDTLKLGVGLLATATALNRVDNDLVLRWTGNANDKVTLQNFFAGDAYQLESIVFADGTKWSITDIAAKLTQNGSAGDDSISGLSDYSNRINGLDGNDHLYGGSKDDVLDGGVGNDVLIGGEGNDTLTGGVGNDTLYGGSGNDTYIFNQGDGQDTINDGDNTVGNVDTLKLGTGLLATATALNRVDNDLVLPWTGNANDKVTLQNFFAGDAYQLESIVFADGTKWSITDIAAKLTQNGSAGDDNISGLWNYSNRMNGLAGNDYLYGGSKDDVIDGGAGNDMLTGYGGNDGLIGGAGNDLLDGGEGNDTLTGGVGNDTLYGGTGNDTYTFNQGDGQDTINDYDYTTGNVDTLQLGAGLTAATMVIGRTSNDLSLTWGADSVTVANFYSGIGNQIKRIEFADGSVWCAHADGSGFSPIVGTVTLSGTATQNQNLTATNTLAGLGNLGTVKYQWQSSADGVTWSVISGATASSLSLTQAQVGKRVRVVANYTDGQGTVQRVSSLATSLVVNVNDAPTGTVTVSGTATQNQSLTAANTLADVDGLGTVNYQWHSSTDGVAWSAITGATASSLSLGQAQVGKRVRVVARYTDGLGSVESVSSAATSAVVNVNDAPTGTVTVNGTATQNQILTAANTLADVDGLGTVSYQWQSSTDGVTWSAISGATASSFSLGQAQVGKRVRVVARYTDGLGSVESVSSAATSAVVNVNDAPTGIVTVNGTATQNQILTAANTLADVDGLGVVSYQWQSGVSGVNGVTWSTISGATTSGLSLTQTQVGKQVRVVTSYTDGLGTVERVNSAATTSVLSLGATTGNDVLVGTVGADVLAGGLGNDSYVVNNTGDVVYENANEGTDTVNASLSHTLGANVENLTLTGAAAINGTGNALNNVITGNQAANTLNGGAGNDTYVFGRGYGQDTLVDTDATLGNTDVLSFGSGISNSQLWFQHVGANLEVSIIGGTDKAIVLNWYGGSQNQIEQIKTSDGKTLLNTDVERLVQAMAAFAPPASGQTTLPTHYQMALAPVIAANWR